MVSQTKRTRRKAANRRRTKDDEGPRAKHPVRPPMTVIDRFATKEGKEANRSLALCREVITSGKEPLPKGSTSLLFAGP